MSLTLNQSLFWGNLANGLFVNLIYLFNDFINSFNFFHLYFVNFYPVLILFSFSLLVLSLACCFSKAFRYITIGPLFSFQCEQLLFVSLISSTSLLGCDIETIGVQSCVEWVSVSVMWWLLL